MIKGNLFDSIYRFVQCNRTMDENSLHIVTHVFFGLLLAGIILALAIEDVKTMILPDRLNVLLAGGGAAQCITLALSRGQTAISMHFGVRCRPGDHKDRPYAGFNPTISAPPAPLSAARAHRDASPTTDAGDIPP